MSDFSVNIEYYKYMQEWAKIGVSALTPIAIAFLTYFISNLLNEKQSFLRKGEQTLAEKQKIYSKIGEGLNIIYVYVADIGDFRSYTPDKIIEKKRDVDRTFHMYGPYWSKKTMKLYEQFMISAFSMYTGTGRNAKIRSSSSEKRAAFNLDGKLWEERWDSCFANEFDEGIHEKYRVLTAAFLEDIVNISVD